MLIGAFARWQGGVVPLSLAMLIGAAYALRIIGRLCLGARPHAAPLADLGRAESAAAGLLVAGLVATGLHPAPLLAFSSATLAGIARLFGN